MLNEINAGLKTALTRVNELVAENKALKEALAQPEQELEYCMDYHCAGDCGQPHNQKEMQTFLVAQPEQEPVTDEQMWELWNSQGDDAMEQQAAIAFARAIEAAHGIKGEA